MVEYKENWYALTCAILYDTIITPELALSIIRDDEIQHKRMQEIISGKNYGAHTRDIARALHITQNAVYSYMSHYKDRLQGKVGW